MKRIAEWHPGGIIASWEDPAQWPAIHSHFKLRVVLRKSKSSYSRTPMVWIRGPLSEGPRWGERAGKGKGKRERERLREAGGSGNGVPAKMHMRREKRSADCRGPRVGASANQTASCSGLGLIFFFH